MEEHRNNTKIKESLTPPPPHPPFVIFHIIAQVRTVSFGLCACSFNPCIRDLSCLSEPLPRTAHTLTPFDFPTDLTLAFTLKLNVIFCHVLISCMNALFTFV